MTRKQLVLLAIMMLLPLLIMLGFFAVLSLEVQRANDLMLNSIDSRVNTIVLATLEKVKEDVSLILPSPPLSNPSEPQQELKSKTKDIKLEGNVTLTTLDESTFFVNNRLYELGDIIAPYGIVIAVGRDMIVFQGFDGQITVFGQTFDTQESSSDESQAKKLESSSIKEQA